MPPIATFINIPKNASHSVKAILGLEEPHPVPPVRSNMPIIYDSHARGIVLEKRYGISDTFTFCFVRNPFDRFVSWFEYHKAFHKHFGERYMFWDWWKAGFPHHWDLFANLNLTPYLQVNWVKGVRVDFIGRVETFERDITLICKKLDRSGNAPLNTHLNKIHRPLPLRKYFENSHLQAEVRELLREDLDYFGYPDEVPDL